MIKKSISIFLIILCLFTTLSVFGCSNEGGGDGSYEYSFYLSNDNAVLEKGETFQLIATYGNNIVTFESSNTEVAQITQDGVITAKNNGKTQIIVRSSDKERICEIEVVTYTYSVSLNKTGTIFVYNDNLTIVELTAFAKRNGETYTDTLSWTVSNFENCNFSYNGSTAVFSPKQTGEFIVTVTSGKGMQAAVTIRVVDTENNFS